MLYTSTVNYSGLSIGQTESPGRTLTIWIRLTQNHFQCVLICLNGKPTSLQVGLQQQHFPHWRKTLSISDVKVHSATSSGPKHPSASGTNAQLLCQDRGALLAGGDIWSAYCMHQGILCRRAPGKCERPNSSGPPACHSAYRDWLFCLQLICQIFPVGLCSASSLSMQVFVRRLDQNDKIS